MTIVLNVLSYPKVWGKFLKINNLKMNKGKNISFAPTGENEAHFFL